MSEPGAPLHGVNVELKLRRYDWSRSADLPELMADAKREQAVIAISSEGGLFDYGSNDEVVANLQMLHGAALVVGSVTRADELTRNTHRSNGMSLKLRGYAAFGELAERAGWRDRARHRAADLRSGRARSGAPGQIGTPAHRALGRYRRPRTRAKLSRSIVRGALHGRRNSSPVASPSPRKPRSRRCAQPKTAGTAAIRRRLRSRTRKTASGEIVRSSCGAGKRSPRSSRASGRRSSSTGSSRSCGRSTPIALLCASPTSGTTIRTTGFALMGTRTGSSTSAGSCVGASHRSTICQSVRQIANFTGRHRDRGLRIIRDSPISACNPLR